MILKYFLNILGQSLARASLLLGAILNACISWLDKLDLILEPNIQRYTPIIRRASDPAR